MEDFYALRLGGMWRSFRAEHFSFWMICGYLFIEYVRPQSIFPAIDIIPWAQAFLILSLVGALAEGRQRFTVDQTNVWISLFFFSVIFSSFNATYQTIAFSKLSDTYFWIIIYFLIINIITTRKRFHIFLFIFLMASFKISFSLAINWASRGFSFTSWGLMGPPGFFENSGELAIQMAVYGPIAYAVAQTIAPHLVRWKKYAMYAMPITAIMVILGASSRGGQLAMAGQIALTFIRYIFRARVLAVGIIVITLGWWILPPEQKLRFTEMGEDQSSQQRLLYWQRGMEMLRNNPISGVGYYNFAPYFERHYPQDLLLGFAQLPHNIFIQVGSELGYTGLIVYLALLVRGFSLGRAIRAHGIACAIVDGGYCERFGRAANVSLLGFIIAGQFVSVVYYPFLWIHLALLVSLNNILKSEKQIKQGEQNLA